MKKKILMSSVLSIVLCLTLICGATFALFTDTDQVDIAVTSGKVDIEVTVENIQTISREQDKWDDDKLFTNGGKVEFAEDSNKLTIDRITPGDAVKFDLVVTNKSNVDIKFFTKLGLVDGVKLFKGMKYTINSTDAETKEITSESFSGLTKVSDWVELKGLTGDKTEAEVSRIEVIIELPYLSIEQNDLQDETTELYYTVQAVQANADAADMEAVIAGETYIYSAIDLQLFAENVNNGNTYKGETVKLMNDIDMTGKTWTPIVGFYGTLDGAKQAATTYSLRAAAPECYTISNLTVSGNSCVGFFAEISGGSTVQNIIFDNAKISGNHYVGVVFGWEGSESLINYVKNVHVTNSEVVATTEMVDGKWDNGDKAGGIGGYAVTASITGCSVTDTTVTAYRDFGGVLGCANGKNTTVSDCAVSGVTLTVDNTNNYKNYTAPADYDASDIVGQAAAGKIDANTAEEVSINHNINGVKYIEEDGEVILYHVTSAFTDSVLVIPEGVTHLGNGSIGTNASKFVKKVVCPSTLKTMGRAFEKNTVIEEVVLNEGLTAIPEKAFNQATALKKVNIPSTVETIGFNAFRAIAVEELTIPATVKELAEGAFRDMPNVKTVTIEGDIVIGNFAFRECKVLEKVLLLGSDISFVTPSIVFSNKQTGDSSGLVIYVVNETVKNAVKAANGSGSGYSIALLGDIVAPEENATPAENGTALKNAIADAIANATPEAPATVYVSEGTYTFPASSLNENVTLICAEGTVFEGTSSFDIKGATVIGATFDAKDADYNSNFSRIDGVYKNCTFTGASEGLRYCYAGETVVFENCVINTTRRGIHFDDRVGGTSGEVLFKNCQISGFNAFAGGLSKVTFEGCTFTKGDSNYVGLNLYCDVDLINCAFEYETTTNTGKEFIDYEQKEGGRTLTITNCTATANGVAFNIANKIGGSQLAKNIVVLDGKEFVHTAEAFAAALKANKSIYLGSDITVTGYWDSRNAKPTAPVVIDGLGHTIKFTGLINDGDNFRAALRFEAATTVKNLTMDLSEATAKFQNKHWAICSADVDLTVDNCTFIGNTAVSGRAIGFGYGSAAGKGTVTITNCNFTNWTKAITDNENGTDVKAVAVSGCTFTNASAYIKAVESISFTNNKTVNSAVDVQSYNDYATVVTVVTGNTLDAACSATIGSITRPFTAANVTVQEGVTVYAN